MFIAETSSTNVLRDIISERKDFGFRIYDYSGNINLEYIAKFWKDNGESTPERLCSRHYEPRQKSMPLLREDTGLACAIRPEIIKSNGRTGDNVLIFKNDDEYSGIDIHDEKTLWLANAAFSYCLNLKKNPYVTLLGDDI